MNILALDLATRTGWATGSDRVSDSGVQVSDVKRGESPGMRYVRFRRWLADMLQVYIPELVIIEQAHHRGGAATEVAAGFSTRVQEACAEKGIEHTTCHSATLKKFATGKGNAEKGAMILAAKVKWPDATIEDDNEADARWLWQYAHDTLSGVKA
jgi:Holliday junction resolvasome RuvABC endonuclease subunit